MRRVWALELAAVGDEDGVVGFVGFVDGEFGELLEDGLAGDDVPEYGVFGV